MKKFFVVSLLLLGAASLCFSGCSLFQKDIEAATGTYQPYTAGFEYTARRTLPESEVPDEIRDLELEKDEDYDVTYEQVTATSSYDNICTMGVNNEILYPGALIDMTNGSYRPIPVERAPITISTNLETVTGIENPIFTEVDPTLSGVRTGIQQIVSENIGSTTNLPANLSYEIREVNNEQEFMMNLGFGLQVGKFSLSENFSTDNIDKQTNLALVLRQIYYTVDMDVPQQKNGRDLFASSLSAREINNALEGTIPAYVSSVSYGRIAVVSIQSNYSKEEIMNALSVGWGKMSDSPGSSPTKRLSTEFDTTLKNIATDSDTKIQCFVYGGSTSQNVAIGPDSAESLSSIFSEFNGSGESALPISYTLRHLNGELAKVQSNNEYVIKHVTYNPKKLMDWSYLDTLLQNGTLFERDTLKLDFSAMVDYSDPEETDTQANRTLIIPDNIGDLYILGPNRGTGKVEYNNFSIVIDYRNDPLTIHLDSITFNGNSLDKGEGGLAANGRCIYGDISQKVTVEIARTVVLKGNIGAPAVECNDLTICGNGRLTVYGGTGEEGQTGQPAISAQTLDITGGEITLQGGTGGTGAAGKAGGQGSKGENGLNQVAGKNGGAGKAGAAAANGAAGGYAVIAKSVQVSTPAVVQFIGGTGGTGGSGGAGGIGGTGGIGYAGVIGSAGGGNGGTGGNGGSGGTGGVGGNALSCETLTINNTTVTAKAGDGGIGGDGGAGGTGGTGGNTTQWGAYCGSPGGGGSGGNGGNGGNGGKAGTLDLSGIATDISQGGQLICAEGKNGEGGSGGDGGKVGNVGKADLDRKPKDSGTPGKKGADGQRG